MRIAVTGGGTGGHVYPALEVALAAIRGGDEVKYFGSLRGMEGSACTSAGIAFVGYPVQPIPRLYTPAGLSAVVRVLTSARRVRHDLRDWGADCLFSTGGYSASPAITAAKSLRLPIVIHEQNSVPGRTSKMAASAAKQVCTVFETAKNHFRRNVIRTGMPVRAEMISAAQRSLPRSQVLVYGGSQGSRAINTVASPVAEVSASHKHPWLLLSGKGLREEVPNARNPNVRVLSFLSGEQLAEEYSTTSVAVARSGCGTIAELALFGIPAVYIPLPTSFANHQLYNAREISEIGGGTVLEQSALTSDAITREVDAWHDEARSSRAAAALREWSRPDATARVLTVVKEAAHAPSN